jgi:small-conductance mechanosensitive channel
VIANTVIALFLAFGVDIIVESVSNDHLKKPKVESTFRQTFLYAATHSVALSARVYLSLLIAELVLDRFPVVTVTVSLREAAPAVAFLAWMGMTACNIKRIVFWQSIKGKKLGRIALLDRVLDFVIFLVTLLAVLDKLNVDMSRGLQSVLSAGGIGALVFSLASKDLAEQIVGGFALNAWDAFAPGDKVRLQDKTEGIVLEIGLIETMIQQFDNIVVRIPNSQLTRARVSNLSRVHRSRLKQYLRFKYADLEKLPAVLEEIKTEIRLSCPKLVTEGKPFHAVLVQYKEDHVEGMVIAHFDIQPSTGEFIQNRHQVVLAIFRAMRKHGVVMALPSIVYHGSGDAAVASNSA